MARSSSAVKKSVDLASSGPRVSRIRRDPPPVVKEKLVDPDVVDRRDVAIGVIAFALSIFVIILAFGGYTGKSSQQQPVVVRIDE